MTVLVSVINFILKTVNIKSVQFIGLFTEGNQNSFIMTFYFISSFLNTGIILLLVNANLEFSPISFVPINNLYTDLDRYWYMDIGATFVKSQVILASMPIFLFFGMKGMQVAFRMLDAGFCYFYTPMEQRRTKKRSMKLYRDLWSGLPYTMYAQYTSVLVMVFVSFMYGLILPILFPITLFGLIVMYINERLQLAYNHPKPPMYGVELNNKVLFILKQAPLAMLMIAYWALGNNQMFDNHVSYITNKSSPQNPHHDLFVNFEHGIRTDQLILVLFGFAIIIKLWVKLSASRESSALKVDREDWFEMDEGLDNYFNSFRGIDQKNMYAREVYYRSKYGVKTMSD